MLRCNKAFYIGSTTNLYQRKRDHLSMLENNDHPNAIIQSAYNATRSLEFIPLDYIKIQPGESKDSFKSRIRDAEQKALNEYAGDPNITNPTSVASGTMRPFKRAASSRKGIQLTSEHKAKLSAAKKGERNPKAKSVIVTNPDGSQTTFPTGTSAAAFFRVPQQLFDQWMHGTTNWPSERSRPHNTWIAAYSAKYA